MRSKQILFFLLLACIFAIPALAEKAHEDIEIGFIYPSPVGDNGWSYIHDLARKKLDAMPGVSTSFVESVPAGADAERVITSMVRKGIKIIFATSFEYMDPMLKVAKKFPNTAFMHCAGYKTAENMSNYMGRMYQARYLSGLVAGSMTKTNKLGYVAAFPIPEVIRGINAFTLGVQAVNPEAKVNVVWTRSWYDPTGEKEAAKSLIDTGCDVIAQHQNSTAPQEAAEEAGVYSVGYNSDMSGTAPNAHLTAPIWDWTNVYKDISEKVRAGTWKNGAYWYGIETGTVGLAPYGKMVPENVRELTDNAKKDITDGSLKPFAGPIKDQAGAVRVPNDEQLSDKELLSMDWFVQGVVGNTK